MDSGDYEVARRRRERGGARADSIGSAYGRCRSTSKTSGSCLQRAARCDTVISALSYHHNPPVAERHWRGRQLFRPDRRRGHERGRSRDRRRPGDGQIFMPQCGLAPGFISIVANHLIKWFERLETVKMRVGALPQFPTGELKYNLTWSTDGLINEYCNPCEAIHDGKRIDCCRWKVRSILARRRALRSVQHQRRAGHVVRHSGRQGARIELQDGPLRGPSRPDEVARSTSCG